MTSVGVVLDTDAVLDLIKEVAEEVVNPRFRDLAEEEVDEKNPGDLVTVADHEAEELLTRPCRGLPGRAGARRGGVRRATRPDDAATRAAEHAFTVDPVDGTKNFVNGLPRPRRDGGGGPRRRGGAGVDLAAPARAGVRRRARRRRLAATASGWCRRRRPGDPAAWRGVTSRGRWLGRALGELRPLELTWVCCGVDYPQLIEGDADFLALRPAANPWDHAPGSLLLTEAGGFLGTHDGGATGPATRWVGRRPAGLVAAADRATYEPWWAARDR